MKSLPRLIVVTVVLLSANSAGAKIRDSRLLSWMPHDSDLILLVDLRAFRAGYESFWREVHNSPLRSGGKVAADQIGQLKASVEQHANLLLSSLNAQGVEDWEAVAIAWTAHRGEGRFVVAAAGDFSEQDVKALIPGGKWSKVAGHEVWAGEGDRVAFKREEILVITYRDLLGKLSGTGAKLAALTSRHTRILEKSGPGFVARCSFVLPEPLRATGGQALGDVENAFFELGQRLKWRLVAVSEDAAERLERNLAIVRYLAIGGWSLARAAAHLLVANELHAYPRMPMPLRQLLVLDSAFLATTDRLFARPGEVGEIVRKGRAVSLDLPAASTPGLLAVLGMGYGFGLWTYQKVSSIEQELRSAWKLSPVVVFNQSMPAGAVLDYPHVAKMMFPSQFISPAMVLPAQFEAYIGKRLVAPVSRGDLLMSSVFEDQREQAGKAEPKKVSSLVFMKDLPAGTAVAREHLGVVWMPAEQTGGSLVRSKDGGKIIGRKTRFAVQRGDFIMEQLLVPKK